MTWDPPDYGQPRFLFTECPAGYPPAIAWRRRQSGLARRRSRTWGAWLRRAHLRQLALRRDERRNALARLAATAEVLGWNAGRRS
jgi:hypothetical protein